MKKPLLLFFIITLCLGCDLQKKHQSGREFPAESGNSPEKQAGWEFSSTPETKPAIEESGSTPEKKYTYEEFKAEFKDSFDIWDMPIGTWFWDEFGEFEAQYGLSADESKLLGEWVNATYIKGPYYNRYVFYPNKLFLIDFDFEDFRVIDEKEAYFDKAAGTWEIAGGFVRITIYAVVTEDRTKAHPDNEGVFFLERPYSFDFINIDDIDRQGFTARPVNNAIMLSEELRRKASIVKSNMTNNLYVRTVYSINLAHNMKNYFCLRIVPDMARDGISGYKVATDTRLIKKYIFGLWP